MAEIHPTPGVFQRVSLALPSEKWMYSMPHNKLDDLRSPPGNRLEALKGNLEGFHSIRVNDQWRIIFRWNDGAEDVSLVDYH